MDEDNLSQQFQQGLENRHSLAEKFEEIDRYQADLDELEAKISTLQRYRASILDIIAYIRTEIDQIKTQKP